MSVKLEYFSSYFSINGVPQQKGAFRVIIHDETLVGLAILGTGKELVFPVHFSEWIDGTDTPYPTFAALLTDLEAFIFESNASGVPPPPTSPIDQYWVQQNGIWVANSPPSNYQGSALVGTVSTNGTVKIPIVSHDFNVSKDDTVVQVIVQWGWFIEATGQSVEFSAEVDGLLDPQIIIERPQYKFDRHIETVVKDIVFSAGAHNVTIFVRKLNGVGVVVVDDMQITTQEKIKTVGP